MSLTRSAPGRSLGFSLLEMVVAVAILGMSLGALYQAAGGATRIVSTDEKMAYGVELARSLIADNAVVPGAGLRKAGKTEGGFDWLVVAEPATLPESTPLEEGALQRVSVAVKWDDGGKEREVVLHSVVAGKEDTQ